MKIYLVGGAVRNQLMGLPAHDNDYVVVGSTEAEMLALGYEKVGADFPVFLHPETGEEYALARTEKSTGEGYNDFEVDFNPNVTIEQDLERRDFTMNAIAQDIETGEYIDPFDGIEDIKDRRISMTNPKAFLEDPVRILRLARFASQYPAFKMDDDTFFKAITGSTRGATAERVYAELVKGLMGQKPSNFFDVLKETNRLKDWFPEIANLIDVTQPIKWHAEGDAYTHTMMVLDSAAKHGETLAIRFGALVHDLGKGVTPLHKLPAHHGHEDAGVPLVEALCERMKVPNAIRDSAKLSTKHHGHVHKMNEVNDKTIVKWFDDFRKHVDYAWDVGRVAWHDNEGKLPYHKAGNNSWDFWNKIQKISYVKLSNSFSQEEIDAMPIDRRKDVLRKLRINSIREESKF